MTLVNNPFGRDSRGQSLIETALMMPIVLMLILNAINFGYYFFVTVNLTATARSAVTYAIEGSATPLAGAFPSSGPATNTTIGRATVTYLAQQDMTGALWNPTAASVEVCSQANLSGTAGTQVSGGNTLTNCVTCSGTTCGAVNAAGNATPHADPENPSVVAAGSASFVLNRVTVAYSFPPLIPGRPFNIALLAANICNSSTCTFIRTAEMRAM
jgi:Flp pilus assembly protein TadG